MTNLPVPSPRTASVSEIETAADFNMIRDALNFLLNKPLGVFEQATSQSISDSIWTSISFDSTTVDTYGGHSNTTNNSRYTAQVAGWYEPAGSVSFTNNATGSRAARFAKNGGSIAGSAQFAPTVTTPNAAAFAAVSLPVFLNAGDYLEFQAWQSSGAALSTLLASDVNPSFSVTWIHT